MVMLLISLTLTTASGFQTSCEPLGPYNTDPTVAGVAIVQAKEILLSPDTCAGFYGRPMRRVDALQTLAHERAHLLGVTDETEADCRGLLDVPWLARRLHLRVTPQNIWDYVKRSPLRYCY